MTPPRPDHDLSRWLQDKYGPLMTIQNAHEVLPYSVGTIYDLSSQERFGPAKLKVGNKLMFHTDLLAQWILNGGQLN
jgi:hypothetical protein